MWAYIVRRILWTIPIVLGIVLITFALFSLVAADPARQYAGKTATPESLQSIRHEMGLDKALWLNWTTPLKSIKTSPGRMAIQTTWMSGLKPGDRFVLADMPDAKLNGEYVVESDEGPLGLVAKWSGSEPTQLDALPHARLHIAGFTPRLGLAFNSQFFDVLLLRFPDSIRYKESVWTLFARKVPVSLSIQLPAFFISLGLELILALMVAAARGRWPDVLITFLAVLGLSVPTLSLYLGAQWLLGAAIPVFPVAGWERWPYWIRFAALPIIVSVLATLGGGVRFYRTVILEEINADYVRTARAKGVPNREIYLTHVMRNIMIPVITNTVAALPFLLLGALVLERLFQIPGIGGLLVESIFNTDRSIVMAIVYVTSIGYCLALLLTDILYAVVDPRVSLK